MHYFVYFKRSINVYYKNHEYEVIHDLPNSGNADDFD